MYGIVPGIAKAEQHSRAPRAKEFAPIILDIFSIRKPDLTIVDAVVSMDGNGPSGGRLRKTDFIIASSDAVAIDSVLMKIIGMKVFDLYTNKEAHERGLGVTNLDEIEILGESIANVRVNDFKFSQLGILNKTPKPFLWLIKYLMVFRIDIDSRECLRCKLCEEGCPASAITISEHNKSVDHSKCLLCLCCREICPHGAIITNRSWLARKMWG